MQSRFQVSLRMAIGVPIALLFTVTVALQFFTQQRQTGLLLDQESVRLLNAITNTSRTRLANFLEAPFQIQRSVGDVIQRQRLYRAGDMRAIYEHLSGVLTELYADREQINILSFGSQDGNYTGIRRENGHFRLFLKDRSTHGVMHIYKDATPSQVVASHDYDPRVRPWYTPVARSGEAAWSPIYASADGLGAVTISAASPVVVDGKMVGVMEADVRLDSLNRFLRDEPLRGNGQITIIDNAGRLVAHSQPESVLSAQSQGLPPGERLAAAHSSSPVIRKAMQHVGSALSPASNFRFAQDGQLYFGRVTPFSDVRGIDWRIIVLLPESDLLGETRSLMGRSMLASIGIALLALLLGLWVLQRVAQSILMTADAANRLALGEWKSGLLQRSILRETSTLARAFNQMAERLQQSFAQMREQLVTDQLTQLLTRRGLLERALWPQARPMVLTLVGLDAFRAINDNGGFGTGDCLLHAVADRMREHMPDALIARLSGDEFALLHLNAALLNEETIGKAVLGLFATPFATGADEVMLNASAGVVGGLMRGAELPEWLRHASIALGDAKRHGRSQCVVFEAGMAEQSMERTRLAIELRQALTQETSQFQVHYQPVIHLATGRVTGAEALLRWNSPTRGMVPPCVFIPLAEESDLILGLGDWVLRHATQAIGALRDKLPPHFDIHVNVSARQLIQSDFLDLLKEVLHASGLPPEQLTLELTESVLIEDDTPTQERLIAIRALGVKVAIDDFGTGYSSLAYMSQLPFDCLKVDQSFVRNLLESPQDAAIVKAVLNMANGFGVTVVAEGVETASQASRLQAMGCHSAQGYCFGRPAPLDQLDYSDRRITPEQ